jgi:hypothetical protein
LDAGHPVILPDEYHDAWLSGEAGKDILVPFSADRMKAWPISARVNSPKNNDAEIIVPTKLGSVLRAENQPQLLMPSVEVNQLARPDPCNIPMEWTGNFSHEPCP